MLHRSFRIRAVLAAVGVLNLTCAYIREGVREMTDPMTSSIHARNSSEQKALAALDAYVLSARTVIKLYDAAGTHVTCVSEYFCAYDPSEKTIKADKPCYDALRTYGETYDKAFGVYHSRWFGDVFGWVVDSGTAEQGSEDEKSTRVTRIDQFMIDKLGELWRDNANNPIASIVLRDYREVRAATCCEKVTLFRDWYNTLTLVPFPTSALPNKTVRGVCK